MTEKIKIRYTHRAICAKEGTEEEVSAEKARRYVSEGVAVVVTEKKKQPKKEGVENEQKLQ